MRYFKIVIWSLLIIVGVIFVLQNDDLQRPVRLTFNLYILPSVTHKIIPKATPPEEVGGRRLWSRGLLLTRLLLTRLE